MKVRVSSIKKLVDSDDDDDDDDGSGMKETDLEPEEMEELNMEKRIQQATKKMEEIVKQQLRDSGVLPSGMLPFSVLRGLRLSCNMRHLSMCNVTRPKF